VLLPTTGAHASFQYTTLVAHSALTVSAAVVSSATVMFHERSCGWWWPWVAAVMAVMLLKC